MISLRKRKVDWCYRDGWKERQCTIFIVINFQNNSIKDRWGKYAYEVVDFRASIDRFSIVSIY